MTPAEFKAAREYLCLSQGDLAEIWGLGKNGDRTIRKWENGERRINPVAVWAIKAMMGGKEQNDDDR